MSAVRYLLDAMTATTARQVQLVRYPEGKVRPDDFRVVEAPVERPADDEVLIRNTWCSVDPGMRLQMRPAGPAGYFPAFALEAPLGGMAVGEVVESRSAHFAPGDVVVHAHGWRDYAVVGAGGRRCAASAPCAASTPRSPRRRRTSVSSAAPA